MNTSAWVNPSNTSFEFFSFFTPIQPIQDADLISQLPYIPWLKEILMLRQVHALEHATVWILSERERSIVNSTFLKNPVDNELLGGLSTNEGFYLYGQVQEWDLRRAVRLALERLTQGESELAIHPRCGTNLSVNMLVTAGLVVGMHLLLPRGPIEQLVGLGVAATTAAQLAPEIGNLAQRYLTTAIPFNLEIADIKLTHDAWGRQAYFVQVRWVE